MCVRCEVCVRVRLRGRGGSAQELHVSATCQGNAKEMGVGGEGERVGWLEGAWTALAARTDSLRKCGGWRRRGARGRARRSRASSRAVAVACTREPSFATKATTAVGGGSCALLAVALEPDSLAAAAVLRPGVTGFAPAPSLDRGWLPERADTGSSPVPTRRSQRLPRTISSCTATRDEPTLCPPTVIAPRAEAASANLLPAGNADTPAGVPGRAAAKGVPGREAPPAAWMACVGSANSPVRSARRRAAATTSVAAAAGRGRDENGREGWGSGR
ncbi:hypothetical protein T492DRAFT_1122289 [Pavlovales sp. CCMP2436]|nr:hypothetical protein T492DRAFT_1122289 [Pavlovales sp. CCMP2436]